MMRFILAVVLFVINAGSINGVSDISIYNVTDILISPNNATNERINELKDKLEVIDKYVIDNDKLSRLLVNVTKESGLNKTNFYEALGGEDHFKPLLEDENKNLYLKLKENVNRDDVFDILAENNNARALAKGARKMMDDGHFENEEDAVNDAVDKMIAEEPVDDHKFDAKANESIYWDPQGELEDRQNFHQNTRRIFKGERTTVRYYPFMVSVNVMGRFWCGGVIYWHDLVLTSAACLQLMHNNRFFRENPKVLSVRVGSNHSRIGGELIDALEVYFHPSYNPRTLENNIAVVRLRRHLYFNYHRIPKVISISHSADSIPATAEVLLLGWGVTKLSQKVAYEPIFLQRKFLPIYPNYFCKEVYGDKFITDTMFCAGTLTTGEGACDHDAGGPAILSGQLVGIISFGPAVCGFPDAPTVFTRVGAFADWIETVNETMPSYYRGKSRTTTTTKSPIVDYFNEYDPFKATMGSDLVPFVSGPTAATTDTPPPEMPPPYKRELKGGWKRKKRLRVDTDEGWSIEK